MECHWSSSSRERALEDVNRLRFRLAEAYYSIDSRHNKRQRCHFGMLLLPTLCYVTESRKEDELEPGAAYRYLENTSTKEEEGPLPAHNRLRGSRDCRWPVVRLELLHIEGMLQDWIQEKFKEQLVQMESVIKEHFGRGRERCGRSGVPQCCCR